MKNINGIPVTFEVTKSKKSKELIIHYGFHTSPFGEVLIGMTNKGICALHFVDKSHRVALDQLHKDFNGATFVEDQASTITTVQHIFSRLPHAKGPFELHLMGTEFQLKVWKALLSIQSGRTLAYWDIAQNIGQPTAARAVGTAVGSNHVAFLVPCHRIITKYGNIGGYRWGVDRKKHILEWESKES
jgi:AraC family transcriptional regulator of adaptative response/methylated-DNA-[protein]-cysteine methyltransferase